MGKMAIPPASERAATRTLAKEILETVENDDAMQSALPFEPRPVHGAGAHYLATDIEPVLAQLAQEIDLLFNDQLAFIEHAAFTATQTAVPDEVKRKLLWEIIQAARGQLPDWWPEFKEAERKQGDKL